MWCGNHEVCLVRNSYTFATKVCKVCHDSFFSRRLKRPNSGSSSDPRWKWGTNSPLFIWEASTSTSCVSEPTQPPGFRNKLARLPIAIPSHLQVWQAWDAKKRSSCREDFFVANRIKQIGVFQNFGSCCSIIIFLLREYCCFHSFHMFSGFHHFQFANVHETLDHLWIDLPGGIRSGGWRSILLNVWLVGYLFIYIFICGLQNIWYYMYIIICYICHLVSFVIYTVIRQSYVILSYVTY